MLDAIGSYAIAAQVVFVAGITVAAHLSGAGLADRQRSVLTIGVCTRNLGAALAPLSAVDADPGSLVMIAIAAPVTLVMSSLAARWLTPRRRSADTPVFID
jgi:BASS family bile acid:Na+ symporter